MRVITFDPKNHQAFEIGAQLMAALAFPSAAEQMAMNAAAAGFCAEVIRRSCEDSPKDGGRLRADFAEYASIGPKEVRRRHRTLGRRLHDRMIAALMSLAFIEHDITGVMPPLPRGMSRFSLNELAKYVLSQSHESVPENIEKRVWRCTLPIISTAIAYQMMLRCQDKPASIYGVDVQNLEFHRQVVELSQFYEELVLDDKRFNIAPSDLIRFRWVEW